MIKAEFKPTSKPEILYPMLKKVSWETGGIKAVGLFTDVSYCTILYSEALFYKVGRGTRVDTPSEWTPLEADLVLKNKIN